MTLPFVSCLCPTYGRYPSHGWLLEEAVECFLLQDYPEDRCELIILNDAPEQTLVCDSPGVRVVNATARYATLGEKRNAMVEIAGPDGFSDRLHVLLPWDDDDISLGWRIRQAVGRLQLREPWAGAFLCGYWNPRHYWWSVGNGTLMVPGSLGYAHNCSAYTRYAFETVGGYPAVSGTEDRDMDARLRPEYPFPGRMVADGINRLQPEQWPYIYRWGVSPRHLSGIADTEQHYADIGKQPVVPGRFHIRPRWRRDYALMARTAAAKLKEQSA